MLENQRDEVQRSTSDLHQKICQNCMTNLKELEEKEQQLQSLQRKIDNLQSQMVNQLSSDQESLGQMKTLRVELDE